MDDLIAKIRAEIDKDERIALETTEHRWVEGSLWFRWMMVPRKDGHGSEQVASEDARHMARHDPARVLRQVAAHRMILELHQPYPQVQHMASGEIEACSSCGSVDDSPTEWPCPTVHWLADAYGIKHP